MKFNSLLLLFLIYKSLFEISHFSLDVNLSKNHIKVPGFGTTAFIVVDGTSAPTNIHYLVERLLRANVSFFHASKAEFHQFGLLRNEMQMVNTLSFLVSLFSDLDADINPSPMCLLMLKGIDALWVCDKDLSRSLYIAKNFRILSVDFGVNGM